MRWKDKSKTYKEGEQTTMRWFAWVPTLVEGYWVLFEYYYTVYEWHNNGGWAEVEKKLI